MLEVLRREIQDLFNTCLRSKDIGVSTTLLTKLTFDMEFHTAAFAASLISGLTVELPAVSDLSPTELQGGNRVYKGRLVSIAGNDL